MQTTFKLIFMACLSASIYMHAEAQTQQTSGAGTVVTYGFTNDCDIDASLFSIQHIIDELSPLIHAEIRVVHGTYNENLIIEDLNFNLVGGFESCSAAENNEVTTDLTVLNGQLQNKPVIQIETNSERKNVQIKNFFVTGGRTSGAGILVFNADVDLALENLIIDDNHGFKGGGLGVFIGEANLTLTDVLIRNNSADTGGGIFCNGGNNQITLIPTGQVATGVSDNQAINGSGGGAKLESGCKLHAYGDSKLSEAFSGNSASDNGGGVAVDNSELVLVGNQECINDGQCFGNNVQPASVRNNIADADGDGDGFGGGVYVTGPQGVFSGHAVDISNNQADNGGGIAADNQATVVLSSTSNNCWNPTACNRLNNNLAHSSGGAIDIRESATARLFRTLINFNQAGFGAAGFMQNNAQLSLFGNLIVNNGSASNGASDTLFQLSNTNPNVFTDNKLSLFFSTLADNDIGVALISNATSSVFVNGSIIHQNDSTDEIYQHIAPVSQNFTCLLSHENQTIFDFSDQVLVDSPNFVDRNSGNYHLAADSPAIDLCGQLQGSNERDIDFETRGFDHPNHDNVFGRFDAGADEVGNDLIFSDGFERRL